MHVYGVQVTEGERTGFSWAGVATDHEHATALARQAFEQVLRRPPDHELVTSGRLQ